MNIFSGSTLAYLLIDFLRVIKSSDSLENLMSRVIGSDSITRDDSRVIESVTHEKRVMKIPN